MWRDARLALERRDAIAAAAHIARAGETAKGGGEGRLFRRVGLREEMHCKM